MPDVDVLTVPGVTGVTADEPALDLGYTVSVDAFSGPLDLLLFLVRKSELDIIDIPVATITDQFVALISLWQQQGELDLEVAGDFILMAATLLEIKARTIAPPPIDEGEQSPEDEDDALDPRADLIGKLLAYRRFKEAVGLLNHLEAGRAQRVLRQTREEIPEDPEEAAGIDLGELDVTLLSKLWNTLLIRIGGGGPRTVMKDEMPIEGSIRKLTARAGVEKNLTLRQLFAAEETLQGRISMLMATLECTRQRIVFSQQHEQYADVELRFRDEAERVITPIVFPPEEPGKKRRRRPPLVTYQAAVPTTSEDLDETPEQPEDKHETDEERFLRELNEACDLDGVLSRVVDVEKGFQAYWDELHPPAAPTIVEVVKVVEVVGVKAPDSEKVEPEKSGVETPAVMLQVAAKLEVMVAVPDAVIASESAVAPETPQAVEFQIAGTLPVAVEISLVPEKRAEVVADQAPIGLASEIIANGASEVLTTETILSSSTATAEGGIPLPDAVSVRAETLHIHMTSEPLFVAETSPVHAVDVAVETTAPVGPEVVLPAVSSLESPQETVAFSVTHEPVIQVDAELVKEVFAVADVAPVSMAETEPRPVEITAEDVADLAADHAGSQAPGDPAIISEQRAPEDHAPVIQPETITQEIARGDELELSTPRDSTPTDTTAEAPVSEKDFQGSSHEIKVQQRAGIPEEGEIAKPVFAITEAIPKVEASIASPGAAEAPGLMITEHGGVNEAPVEQVEQVEPVEPVEPAVFEREVITVAAIAPSPSVPGVRPQRFLSRTLWLLLAGVAGGTIAGWWVSTQSGPMLPSASVMLPADLSTQVAVTPSVPLQPVFPSTPILVIPSVPPSADLQRIAEGPSAIWLQMDAGVAAASPWPVVVPWTACLPHPVVPSSIVSFAEAPCFTGLPHAAWAQDHAWAWCAGGTWTPPRRQRFAHVVPELAFALPLQEPANVAGWLVEPDLRLMPISVFAEPLGWTVLAQPQLLVPTFFIVAVPPIMPADSHQIEELEVPGEYIMSPDFEEFWFDSQATPVVVEPIP